MSSKAYLACRHGARKKPAASIPSSWGAPNRADHLRFFRGLRLTDAACPAKASSLNDIRWFVKASFFQKRYRELARVMAGPNRKEIAGALSHRCVVVITKRFEYAPWPPGRFTRMSFGTLVHGKMHPPPPSQGNRALKPRGKRPWHACLGPQSTMRAGRTRLPSAEPSGPVLRPYPCFSSSFWRCDFG